MARLAGRRKSPPPSALSVGPCDHCRRWGVERPGLQHPVDVVEHHPLDKAEMIGHGAIGPGVRPVEADVEQPIAFLALAKEIAHWHHEKWDGSGYPDALKGEEIPVSARLMAVADVFDALISPRISSQMPSLRGAANTPSCISCYR